MIHCWEERIIQKICNYIQFLLGKLCIFSTASFCQLPPYLFCDEWDCDKKSDWLDILTLLVIESLLMLSSLFFVKSAYIIESTIQCSNIPKGITRFRITNISGVFHLKKLWREKNIFLPLVRFVRSVIGCKCRFTNPFCRGAVSYMGINQYRMLKRKFNEMVVVQSP